ncbi:MAG: 1-(5-phosphoribosyl)-5-[(5-phosphoribosylamino)methylideneamino]imidazole-4-carboxamide isomerase [Kiloniellales bacterium]
MILFPAIDLKDGRAVRLLRGKMESATVFNEDPAAQAKLFAEAGFEWLHLIDLDGAFAGKTMNRAAVDAILNATRLPVQLGGGIRDLAAVESWLAAGVARVILGTAAVKNPALVREACAKFSNKIVVGIDARSGRVAVEGWAETSVVKATTLAKRFEDAGVAAVIYTNIDRDGALEGLDLYGTMELARETRLPVIASGGLAKLDEIAVLLAAPRPGVAGVVCGRSLYDGRIDAKAALELVARAKRKA